MLRMSEHVHLISVIKFLESKGHSLTFEDFKLVFEDKIQTENYFCNVLESANLLVQREVLSH